MTHPTVTTPAPPADDPFRYGWRYVSRPTPNDPDHLEPVPLTLEDVLHPEVGDFIVHSDRHETDRMYLTAVLRARLEVHGRAIVLSDVRVAWDVPDLRPHGPDVMVIPVGFVAVTVHDEVSLFGMQHIFEGERTGSRWSGSSGVGRRT